MTSGKGTLCALIAALLPGLSASGQDFIDWISSTDGDWETGHNWFPLGPPAVTENARHLNMLSRIAIGGLASTHNCLSFEGHAGKSTTNDRYVVVESGHRWRIGDGGLRRSSSSTANFVVQYENGSPGDPTHIQVGITTSAEGVDGIDFVPTTGIGPRGDYFKLEVVEDMVNSSLTVGDHAEIDVGYGDPNLGSVLGPGNGLVQWTIGDASVVDIQRNVSGVDMTIGTSRASSEADRTIVDIGFVGGLGMMINDTWRLRGYADVSVAGSVQVDDPTTRFLLEDKAKLATGGASDGTWHVVESASVISDCVFDPDVLVMDGTSVTANRVGSNSTLGISPFGMARH